jgi:hypothetical protein
MKTLGFFSHTDYTDFTDLNLRNLSKDIFEQFFFIVYIIQIKGFAFCVFLHASVSRSKFT